jgi:predicted nucleotidyltransferase
MAQSEMTQTISEWCQARPVRLCVLFGSQATGKARPESDVDLAIWAESQPDAPTKIRWLGELQTRLDKPVNLVLVSPDLDPVLGFEMVRDGRLLFERIPTSWLKARSQLWHAYNDSLPFRRLARQQLHQFAEEVRHGN